MITPATVAQTEGVVAVVSSALLGIVNWDLVIRSSLLGGALISEIVVLVIAIRIIAQIRREQKQGERKNDNSPSQSN